MRKEIMISILIGLLFGLVITYGVYQTRLGMVKSTDKPIIKDATTNLNPTEAEESQKLTLLSPEDESVQTQTNTKITGSTLPDSYVAIFVNDEEHITSADASGNFSIEAELESGSNVITVFTLDEDGDTTKVERTVIVTDEDGFEDESTEASASATPTPSKAVDQNR